MHQLNNITDLPANRKEESSSQSLWKEIRGVVRSIRFGEVALFQSGPLLGLAFAGGLRVEHASTLLTFLIGNILLFTFIFGFNDWGNLNKDLEDPTRSYKTFLSKGATPRGMLVLSILSAGGCLVFFALCSLSCFLLGVVVVGLGVAYSLPSIDHKAKPLYSSVNHFAGGVSQFLLGYAAIRMVDPPAIAMSLYIAMVLMAGHLIQELRDFHGDSLTGVQTNAVRYGQRRTLLVSTGLFALSYLSLGGMAALNILPATWLPLTLFSGIQAVAFFRFWRSSMEQKDALRYQATYRALFIIIGIYMVYDIVIRSGGFSV